MATYPIQPNLPSFEVPVFEPPLDFMFNVARQKQLQFDRGLESIQAKYNSMESLPVVSPYAMSKRDAYMSIAKEKLKRVAGADFSLEENVNSANSVYKPLTSDRDILLDLQLGRQAQRETSLMDRYQNSKDEKERGQYWDTGREYVERSIRKLQNAKSADELRSVQINKFVPYTDVIGHLNEVAEKLRISVSVDHITGGYILTDKNGKRADLPFYVFAQGQLGEKERAVFRVMGSVEGDRRIEQEMYTKGISETQARQILAAEALENRFKDFTSQIQENTENLKNLQEGISKMEKDGVNDKNYSEWEQKKLKIEMIEKANQAIENRLRDIGYTKVSGQFIPNDRYNNTLKVYSRDLSLPYAEDATRNILTNWAAGLANATAGLEIKADPNYALGIDLMKEQIKASAELAKAATSGGKGTGKTEEEKEDEDFINTPLQVDFNPYGSEKITSYENFKRQKKAFQDGFIQNGVDLINDALPELNLDPDFLDALSESLKNGGGTKGLDEFQAKYPEQVKSIKDAMISGEITASSNNADLLAALVEKATKKVENGVVNGSDLSEAQRLGSLTEEVRKNLEAFQVFKDDENKIQQKILSKPQYSEFSNNGQLLNKEEYVKNKTGYASIDDINNSGILNELSKRFPSWSTNSPDLIQKEFRKIVKSVEDAQKDYDNIKKKFNKDFSDFVNSGESQYLQKAPGTSGQYLYTYPVLEWSTRKNPTSAEREIAEIALSRAFNQTNLSDPTKIANLSSLGDFDDVQPILKYLQSKITDIQPEDGKVYTSQISEDGRTPGVRFKPTVKFLQDATGEKDPLKNETLKNIAEYGIEISANVPEIHQYKPSVVGRLLDINKDYQILPYLKEQGFTGRVKKMTSGRGYEIYLDYKTIDQNGKEKVISNEPQAAKNGGVYFPEGRLDNLVSNLYSEILSAYYAYKNQKNNIQATSDQKPLKVYTKEELEYMYKTRQ